MTKMIRISEDLHELITAHKREGETMEECLRRLFRGPDPAVLAEIIDGPSEDAEAVRDVIERQRERGRDRRRELRERFS